MLMFNLILGAFTIAVVAIAGWVAHRFFSTRQTPEIPPLKDKDLGPREPLSKVLSVVSALALFSPIPATTYRRDMDLYATQLRIVGIIMAAGIFAALANRYFYGRWM